MLSSLPAETRLELAGRRVQEEERGVRLCSTADHVGDEVAVSGCVEHVHFEARRLEVCDADLDCHAACALLAVLVEDPRPLERRLPRLRGLPLVLVQSPRVDAPASCE